MSFSEMSKQITIIFLTDTLLCYNFNFSASLSTWNYMNILRWRIWWYKFKWKTFSPIANS